MMSPPFTHSHGIVRHALSAMDAADRLNRAAALIREAGGILDHVCNAAGPVITAQIEAITGQEQVGSPLAKHLETLADNLNADHEASIAAHDKSCREMDAAIAAASTGEIEVMLAVRTLAVQP